jgi:hypothetical protein
MTADDLKQAAPVVRVPRRKKQAKQDAKLTI